MSQPENEPKERRLSPLARIILLAGGVAMGAILTSQLDGCDPGRPEITRTTLSPETTQPEMEQSLYWEKYGWEGPIDKEVAQSTIERALLTNEPLREATGRCVVMRRSAINSGKEFWVIIQNPIVTTGEANGHTFTTYSGVYEYQLGNAQKEVGLHYTSLIDGIWEWGAIGTVASQADIVEKDVHIFRTPHEELIPDSGDIFFEGIRNFTLWDIQSDAAHQTGKVIVLPLNQEGNIKDYCDLDTVYLQPPPGSPL